MLVDGRSIVVTVVAGLHPVRSDPVFHGALPLEVSQSQQVDKCWRDEAGEQTWRYRLVVVFLLLGGSGVSLSLVLSVVVSNGSLSGCCGRLPLLPLLSVLLPSFVVPASRGGGGISSPR